MSFNSTEFVFFFLAVVFVHWAIARWTKARYLWLCAASCVFYMSWNAKFIVLIVLSSLLDYCCGLALGRTERAGQRKALLALSLVGNLGLLGFFKYFNFFAENVAAGCARLGFEGAARWVPWEIVLPAGISFYTFQTLSYTIDVYRRQLAPTRSLLEFMLFVTFFPQLVAGPIVRASDFLPQLARPARFDESQAARGLFLILCGLAKKVLLADTVGVQLVEPVFARPESFGAGGIVLGVWGALFQFYLDFSAYSDIAIGAAAILGYELCLNFDRPFLAQSISEFWRRWHMSLSTWFRDYVFLPLGGRGAHRLEFLRNMMATMFLTGLWHGAGWNYVLWGLMHGVFTFVGVAFRRPQTKEQLDARPLWERVARRAWIFNLVALSMLFFRNGTLAEGKRGLQGSFEMLELLCSRAAGSAALSSSGLIALAVAAVIHFTPKRWIHERARDAWMALPAPVQGLGLCVFTGALAALSYAKAPFIYFQF
ncbi:MAG: MBOAT family protein [Planctomycetes bacterium]|nr:MBOAT family protein [Planctomycetota bacterium]